MSTAINSTPAHIITKIDNVYKKVEHTVIKLYERWQDERQYEDIKDYGALIQRLLPVDVTMTSMIKSPFGFQFTVEGAPEGAIYQIYLNRNNYGWRRVK